MFMLAWHHREKTTKPERQRARNQKTHGTDRILLMARTKKLSDPNESEDLNSYDEPGTQRQIQVLRRRRSHLEFFVSCALLVFREKN